MSVTMFDVVAVSNEESFGKSQDDASHAVSCARLATKEMHASII